MSRAHRNICDIHRLHSRLLGARAQTALVRGERGTGSRGCPQLDHPYSDLERNGTGIEARCVVVSVIPAKARAMRIHELTGQLETRALGERRDRPL